MYESKYSRFLINNTTRFAEEDEIIDRLVPFGEGAGVPLYERGGVVYVDDFDNHSMTIGGTGCGKSRAVCKTTIRSLMKKHESLIVNDPKGELYRTTSIYAKKKGLNIKVLNLRHPEVSDHWNPLYQVYYYYKNGQISKAEQAINDLASELMQRTANERDRYWDLVASNFFSSLMGVCLRCSTKPSHFTLENILPLLKESSEGIIRSMIGAFDNVSEATKSGLNSVLDLSAEKTKSCIYGVIHAGIDSLVKSDSLLKLLNTNDIDFYKLAEEPTVIYIIYPDEKTSMNNIVSSFLTQAYTALLDICDNREDNKLPIRVNFILDEFSNLCSLDHFSNRISESRSKNIRYHLFIQSLNQLSEKYGEKVAETILSNTTSWTCFSSKEVDFLNTISKLCGTVIDYTGREKPLISSSEMQYLEKGIDGVEVLILRQGVRPYVTRLTYYDKMFETAEASLLDRKVACYIDAVKLAPSDWIHLARERYELSLSKKTDSKDISDEEFDEIVDDEGGDDEELEDLLKKKFDELFGPIDDDDDD